MEDWLERHPADAGDLSERMLQRALVSDSQGTGQLLADNSVVRDR